MEPRTTQDLVYVVYFSSSTHLLSSAEIDDILAVSRRNNARLGVTGMLLYWDGNVVQLLEGPRAAVDALLERIARDPRHRGLLIAARGELAQRHFPEWTMGFAEPAAGARPDGFSDFFSNPRRCAMEEAPRAYQLLLTFRRNLRAA
ncbi:MAG: BLUF domain-containing protein [Deltaproteobacteria bacterium]|nr:BLUF domain-containing protein [Deltaproteobacteria bacterium]